MINCRPLLIHLLCLCAFLYHRYHHHHRNSKKKCHDFVLFRFQISSSSKLKIPPTQAQRELGSWWHCPKKRVQGCTVIDLFGAKRRHLNFKPSYIYAYIRSWSSTLINKLLADWAGCRISNHIEGPPMFSLGGDCLERLPNNGHFAFHPSLQLPIGRVFCRFSQCSWKQWP